MSNAAADSKKARWLKLSPLLDELLDLDGPARSARLASLREQEAALADELQALLAREAGLDGAGFLASPVLPRQLAQTGQTLGAYTLEQEIGRGGMGSVWSARRTDGRFEGRVAIKFLASGLFGQGNAGRFAREGQILARLAHPHIARLLDAGVTPDGAQPYLVLEYVEDGEPIDRHCQRLQLDARARVRLFLDVLAAVAHAHNRLILHRDLKPSNILVDRQGSVKLLDFGIAKLLQKDGDDKADAGAATELTRQAGRAFTPNYAAPEQVQGDEVTTATDVYALGVLLYLLLGDSHPTAPNQPTASQLEQLRTLVEVEPRRLSELLRGQGNKAGARELRGDLDTIVAKALKKTPAQRYANAADLAEDLRRWLNHEPITARPDSRAYRLRKFLRRHRVGVAAGSLAALGLSAGIGLALWKGREAHEQRVQAEGLIEFMLGDLRKKLEPVGRLDVLDAVGGKAMDYYAQQRLSTLDADALGRRARALHLMGEIAEKRGKLDEADRMFREAAASTAELLARAPADGQRLFDHSQSTYWVGFVAWRRGQAAEAQAQFQHYLDLATRLTELAPANLDWRTEKAFAQQNLGVLKLELGQAQAALSDFELTRSTWQALLPQRPELHLELANTLGWLSKAQIDLGHYAAALVAEQTRVATLSAGADAPDNHETLVQNATGHHQVSRMQFLLGHGPEALQSARRAAALLEPLVAQDPANLDWLAQLSTVRLGLAELLAEGTEPRGELGTLLSRLQTDVERLLRADATKVDWQCNLQARLLLLQAGNAPSAPMRDSLARQLDILQALARQGAMFSAEQQRVIAGLELRLGQLARTVPQARAHWESAAARLQPAAHTKNDAASMTLYALARFRLGATEEARALAEKVTATSYRHPDYAELQNLLNPAAVPTAPHSNKGKT